MCDRGSELATLLLDARWLNVRGKFGGILGLKADFAILDKLLQPFTGDGGEKTHLKDFRRSARLILKANLGEASPMDREHSNFICAGGCTV